MANTPDTQVFRPLAYFEPSLWGNLFTSFSMDKQIKEIYTEEHEGLLEKVRVMFFDASKLKISDQINFINTVERLGVSYHIEKEIEEQLHQIFDTHSKFQDDIQQFDLFSLGVYFRILRQHGYRISCDVFNKLKDGNGKFKEELKNDVAGILSLYEATHVRTHGDDILDEAFIYTKAQLESMLAASLSSFLHKQVTQALIQSLHKGIPRVEARHYISVYEEDPNKNDLLLRFSKIDFNLLQMLHRQELHDASRWWNDMEFETKLPYARNRVAECYIWTVSAYYEPKYSLARRILIKLMILVSLTDDTYDAYGTLDELELFTDAVERLDVSSINQLPDYMKIIYKALLDYFGETEDILWKYGIINGSRRVSYAKYMYKEMVRCYDTEYKWFNKGYVPDFEEYMQTALITSGNRLLVTVSFQGMGEVASIKAFEWVKNGPKMIVSSSKVVRLVDDIMSHEEEDERGHVATGIECYQKKYRGSREEIIAEFYERIDDAWKDVNEEFIKPDKLPLDILMRVLNLTRIADVVYKYDDGYTHPQKALKDHIISLFVNPITI